MALISLLYFYDLNLVKLAITNRRIWSYTFRIGMRCHTCRGLMIRVKEDDCSSLPFTSSCIRITLDFVRVYDERVTHKLVLVV